MGGGEGDFYHCSPHFLEFNNSVRSKYYLELKVNYFFPRFVK